MYMCCIIYTIDAYYIYYRYTSYTLQFTATGHTRARKSVQNCVDFRRFIIARYCKTAGGHAITVR